MVLQHLHYLALLVDSQVQRLQPIVMLQAELDLNQLLQLSIMHQEITLLKTERLLLKITKHLLRVYMQTLSRFKYMVAKMLKLLTTVKFIFQSRQNLALI